MDDRAEPWIAVAAGLDERRAAELALVLIARDIEHQRVAGPRGFELWTPAAVAAQATAELEQYLRENSRAVGQRNLERLGDGWPGALAYIAILLLVFVCVRQSPFGLDWFAAGRLEAGKVLAGEWWRAVTALTVHLEVDHLGGNLVFGAFFGYFVGHHLGRGVGWLAVVGAAAAANVLNAAVQAPAHRSIGASTAVFAALGLLTAYTWRRGFFRDTPWRARIAPIIAGLGLLAFTGTGGANTDLGAHLAGFVMGFGAGLALARWGHVEWLRARGVQAVCAAFTLAIVIAAWVWGLAAAG
jgi:membrane associated rhomboid family serine protease